MVDVGHREGGAAPRASGGWRRCCSAGRRRWGELPRLRRAMAQESGCDAAGIVLRVPRPGLCTDNGAMVGGALGAHLVAVGATPSSLDLPANSPSMPVTEVLVG